MPTSNTLLRSARVFFTHHWCAILLALCVGMLCIAPQIFFMLSPAYQGVQMMGTDAEDHYTAQVQEVYDGYPGLGDVFLPQKNIPYIQSSLGPILVAVLGKALGVSAAIAVVVSKFIFPFLAALAVYLFANILFKSRSAALLAGAFALLGDNLISGPSTWVELLHGVSSAGGFITYARPVNPEISGAIMFAGLALFHWAFWQGRRPRIWQLAAIGLAAAALLYISPFAFLFLVTYVTLSFFWFTYSRSYALILQIIAIGAVAFVAIIPFALNYLHLHSSPLYADAMARQGLIQTHTPILSMWLILMLVCVVCAWPKRFAGARPLFFWSTISLFILTNQQILTGHELQPAHYHWYITKPLVCIMLGMYVAVGIERLFSRELYRRAAYVLCIVLVIYNAALIQSGSYRAVYASTVAAQVYVPVFAYLNSLPPQSVWADDTASMYIPIYTQDDTPTSGQLANYLVPTAFLKERLFLNYRLRGITAEDALATMQAERGQVSSAVYSLYWRQQAGGYDKIPDSIIDSLAAEYATAYAQMPLEDMFKDMTATTILWDRSKEPEWNISALSFVKKSYASGGVEVYQILSPQHNVMPTKPINR